MWRTARVSAWVFVVGVDLVQVLDQLPGLKAMCLTHVSKSFVGIPLPLAPLHKHPETNSQAIQLDAFTSIGVLLSLLASSMNFWALSGISFGISPNRLEGRSESVQ